MTERFKHSEFQQDDGQYQYYGIEDTEKNYIYNVIGDGMYDVSEELLINILNELDNENKELKFHLEECRNNKLFSRRELEKENKELKQFKGQVFDLIDIKIEEVNKKFQEYHPERKNDVFLERYRILKNLKEELKE